MVLALLDNSLLPPPQQLNANFQIPRHCCQRLSFCHSLHRRDLKLTRESSPAVSCLFHEPFLRSLSFSQNSCLIFGVHSSALDIRHGTYDVWNLGGRFSNGTCHTSHVECLVHLSNDRITRYWGQKHSPMIP